MKYSCWRLKKNYKILNQPKNSKNKELKKQGETYLEYLNEQKIKSKKMRSIFENYRIEDYNLSRADYHVSSYIKFVLNTNNDDKKNISVTKL